MKYNITEEQMRFVMWLQIISLFILWGFVLLPFTIFYYLGWKKYNLEEGTQFLSFLFKKNDKEAQEDKERIEREASVKKEEKRKMKLGAGFSAFVWIFSFIAIWTNLEQATSIGFESSEDSSRALTELLMYSIAHIISIPFVLRRGKKIDRQKEELGEVKPKGIKSSFNMRLSFVFVFLGIIVWMISPIFTDQKGSDSTKNFEDAIYGTNQTGEDETTLALKEILGKAQELNASQFKNTLTLENSDFLEISSYETKADLRQTIALLEASIPELEQTEAHMERLYDEMEQVIKSSTILSEERKVGVLKSYNETRNDITEATYRRERTKTLIDYYKTIASYYKFLLANFDDYAIESNENNERNIAFYTDANIEIATNFINQINQKLAVFSAADKAFMDYKQSEIDESGLDLNATDVRNAMN